MLRGPGPARGWSCASGWRRQRGQALLYGLFVLIGGLASLFFLFNTGQLAREKTKLVNTSDAVAFSAGILQARALNFDAYNNRALVANEVLVAQMVSLSSWAQYASTHAQYLLTVHPECADPNGYGAAAGATFKYGPLYAAMCYVTVQYASPYIQNISDLVPAVTQGIVLAVEFNKTAIKSAQALLHAPSYLEKIRGDLMQEVANANYADDGQVTVEPLSALSPSSITMNDGWKDFTKQYSGNERDRFKALATNAANADEFTRQRSWTTRALLPTPECLPALRTEWNEVRRRGGTELIGFDEWKAEDTESYHGWWLRRSFFGLLSCRKRESPIAFGEQQAHPSNADQYDGGAYLGGSPSSNPGAHGMASSNHWTNYTGLPSYYDLNPKWLSGADRNADPLMKFGVRVTRKKEQLRTSDGSTGQIKSTSGSRINAYQTNVAGGEMAAVSTTEVFFERPYDQKDNAYGSPRGIPRELGSLFNPYWQVRLVYSTTDVATQQAHQGAVTP